MLLWHCHTCVYHAVVTLPHMYILCCCDIAIHVYTMLLWHCHTCVYHAAFTLFCCLLLFSSPLLISVCCDPNTQEVSLKEGNYILAHDSAILFRPLVSANFEPITEQNVQRRWQINSPIVDRRETRNWEPAVNFDDRPLVLYSLPPEPTSPPFQNPSK